MAFCKLCGREFVKTSNSQKYCCDECRVEAKKLQNKVNSRKSYILSLKNKARKIGICEYCKKPFIKSHGNQKYCSNECTYHKRLEQNSDARMKSYHRHKKRGGDKFYGVGSGGLGPHMNDDPEIEYSKIQKEKQRLKLAAK